MYSPQQPVLFVVYLVSCIFEKTILFFLIIVKSIFENLFSLTMDDSLKIKLTEDEIENIIKYFEQDRAQVTESFGYDEDADMYLQILKTFKEQILENQEIVDRLSQRKEYHQLCKSRFGKGSDMSKFHHFVWQELNQIENGK